MASILDISDYPEQEAFPNIAYNNGEENMGMGNDLLDILDSSVSPVTLLKHYVGQNFSDALYVGWNSDISEEIARLELLVVPNLSDLKYNNYYLDSSSSNINRMPPVPPLHLRLDRNAKNSANESNNSRSDAHTPKHCNPYTLVTLEKLHMKAALPHGRTTTPVDSTEQSEDASQLDKCQGQLIGKNIKVSLENIPLRGRPKQEKLIYPCTRCNKSFARKDHLTRHLRSHSGEKRYECAECGAGFCKQNLLTRHERIHFGHKPFKCPVCGALFQYRRQLDQHQSTHTDYRPFVCDICQKPFRREEFLKEHKNTHTGARPYECKLCNKTFARCSGLFIHRKSLKCRRAAV